MVKVVMLGAAGVGKTAIVQQFMWNTFTPDYQPTDRKHTYFPSIMINDHLYELNITDLPVIPFFPENNAVEWSEFRFYGLRSATAYVLVFDLSNADTFQYIRKIRDQMLASRDLRSVPVLVVGNKRDLLVFPPAQSSTPSTAPVPPVHPAHTGHPAHPGLLGAGLGAAMGAGAGLGGGLGSALGSALGGAGLVPGFGLAAGGGMAGAAALVAPLANSIGGDRGHHHHDHHHHHHHLHHHAPHHHHARPHLHHAVHHLLPHPHHPTDYRERRRDIVSLVRKHWKCGYVECSAKYNWRVVAVFHELMRSIDSSDRAALTKEVVAPIVQDNKCAIL
ncbi:ras-like protein family member 10B [Frankliniella occidentalis]|uniref:Ras-like protein family member 10B n=1 Tax=Frankliniella occidentalis TaxID=133901 RepID=A0A9C6UC14_FRAOC|nr:ras-like protein family member 10B [Frankliniella occidentalis]